MRNGGLFGNLGGNGNNGECLSDFARVLYLICYYEMIEF